jgi:hypothetical protein
MRRYSLGCRQMRRNVRLIAGAASLRLGSAFDAEQFWPWVACHDVTAASFASLLPPLCRLVLALNRIGNELERCIPVNVGNVADISCGGIHPFDGPVAHSYFVSEAGARREFLAAWKRDIGIGAVLLWCYVVAHRPASAIVGIRQT